MTDLKPKPVTPEQQQEIVLTYHGMLIDRALPLLVQQVQEAGKFLSMKNMAVTMIHRESILVDEVSKKQWPETYGMSTYKREEFSKIAEEAEIIDPQTGTKVSPFLSVAVALKQEAPEGHVWVVVVDEHNCATARIGKFEEKPAEAAPAAPADPPVTPG